MPVKPETRATGLAPVLPRSAGASAVFFFFTQLFLLIHAFLPGPALAVTVDTSAELIQAIEDANNGGDTTIIIKDGTYDLDQMLWVDADNVTVRGESGDRDAVVLQGEGMDGGVSHIFNVAGSDFTLSDLSLGQVANHGVQIHGESDADRPVIRNVRFFDTNEQMLKVSYNSSTSAGSDNGLVENCLFIYTAGIGPQYYIGGVDAHNAANWVVRGNQFFNIRSPSSDWAEHAIHFWSDSQGTLVEGNLIVNCDRGIGFGLGDRGHQGGVIVNNMIYHDTSAGDVGIGLESASDVVVANNTLFHEHDYANAIEYRFVATTGCVIVNNLTNRAITSREVGAADTEANVVNADADMFVDAQGHDLHLAEEVDGVADAGVDPDGDYNLVDDYDGDARPQGAGIDIGADEYTDDYQGQSPDDGGDESSSSGGGCGGGVLPGSGTAWFLLALLATLGVVLRRGNRSLRGSIRR